MSALPPGLARRIDRLARRAHAFHRFAHHPLCGAYSGEVIQIGRRMRLCLGCSLATAGALLGAAAGLVSPASLELAGLSLATLIASGALALSRRRLPKILTRALPMAGASACLVLGTRERSLAALALSTVAVAVVSLAIALYRRRGPDRAPCSSCPERTLPKACSGLRPIARRERAFQRLSARWISHGLRAYPGPGQREPESEFH